MCMYSHNFIGSGSHLNLIDPGPTYEAPGTVYSRAVDPHHVNAETDPSFHGSGPQDSRALFWASTPLLWTSTAPFLSLKIPIQCGSGSSFPKSCRSGSATLVESIKCRKSQMVNVNTEQPDLDIIRICSAGLIENLVFIHELLDLVMK